MASRDEQLICIMPRLMHEEEGIPAPDNNKRIYFFRKMTAGESKSDGRMRRM